AITAAMKRDAASGDGINVVRITPDGFQEISDEEIAKRAKKMNLT
ncbi:MAG: proteasome subunit beta, partial [Candidatus Thermoplasmatota archaeon]|nr:proteasome subunit beta [Candidatus Thermoplasmatota archaeon]